MVFGKHAKEYWKAGFAVIPLVPKTKNQPAFSFKKYSEKMPTEQEINDWIKKYPDYNIAILTGNVSNLAVIDVDGKDGLEAIKTRNLPKTWVVETQRGWHYYFRLNDKKVGLAVGFLPHVDLRGNGGYVVAPPSLHSSGKPYSWYIKDGELKEILPDFVFGLVSNHRKEMPEKTGWIDELKKGVREGKRNDSCVKMAGYYFARGLDKKEILDVLLAWNLKNQPPMEESEIEIVADSVDKREKKKSPRPLLLAEAKKIIAKWLYFEDDTVIDIVLAVAATTLSSHDPLWIVLVGAASTGKTELLRSFDGMKDTCFIDRVTPASFATGLKSAKGILELLNNCKKTMVIQDLSSIQSKPPYEKNEIIDNLRQIYNGSYYNHWGSGKKVHWAGKFNLLSGSTLEIESHSSMSELGERFLYCRIASSNATAREEMDKKAWDTGGMEKEAREEISGAIWGVLESVKAINIDEITISQDVVEFLRPLVNITATLRSPVKRNPYRQDQIEYEPQPEGPGRMAKAIKILMKGLAAVRGRTECDIADYEGAVKICADSISSIRRRVLRTLLDNRNKSFMRAKDFARECGYLSTESMKYKLEDLTSLGVCNRKLGDDAEFRGNYVPINTSWLYEIKKETAKVIEKVGLSGVL